MYRFVPGELARLVQRVVIGRDQRCASSCRRFNDYIMAAHKEHMVKKRNATSKTLKKMQSVYVRRHRQSLAPKANRPHNTPTL
jgi:hypothetical protein